VSARAIPVEGIFDLVGSTNANEAAMRRMQTVANVLDTAFAVPGTKQRFGIDAIIGLIPGLGDLVTTILSTYIIWEARNLGVSRVALARMMANLGVHAAFGSLPIAGDLFDAWFRVNQRNLRIVRSQLEKRDRS